MTSHLCFPQIILYIAAKMVTQECKCIMLLTYLKSWTCALKLLLWPNVSFEGTLDFCMSLKCVFHMLFPLPGIHYLQTFLCCAVFSRSVVSSFFVTPWTVSLQVPLSLGILQARIMEWATTPTPRGSSQPRDQTQVSCITQMPLPSEPPEEPHLTIIF